MNKNGEESVGIKTIQIRLRILSMHKCEVNSAVVKKARLHINSEQWMPAEHSCFINYPTSLLASIYFLIRREPPWLQQRIDQERMQQ